MRKLITTLSALLVILMVASPVLAAAETIPMTAVQIADPVIYVDGEPLLDMSGLMLQLAGGSTADGELTQLFVDVFAGGENINSAVLQLDEGGVAGYLSGMSSAYGVSAETLGALPIEGFGSLEELMAALENWTLFDDIEALHTQLEEKMVYGEPEVIEVELAAGMADMTYQPFEVDATEYMHAYMALLGNDALLGPLLNAAAAEDGYESFAAIVEEMDIAYNLSGGMASTEDGMSALIKMDGSMAIDGETMNFESNMLLDGSLGDAQHLTVSMSLFSEESLEEGMTVEMSGVVSGGDVFLEGAISEHDDEGENVVGTFSLNAASADGAGAGTDLVEFAFETPEDGGMTISASSVAATGETRVELKVVDAYTDVSAYCAFSPTESADEGVIASGNLEIGVNDGTSTYAIAAPVRVVMTTIESDDFYIAPENVIDVTAMTEEEAEAASTELGMAFLQMLTKLESAVPGLGGLTEGFMMGEAEEY